jgi:hypothetical protein
MREYRKRHPHLPLRRHPGPAFPPEQLSALDRRTKSGDDTSVRFFFAFFGDFERNDDVSPITPELPGTGKSARWRFRLKTGLQPFIIALCENS